MRKTTSKFEGITYPLFALKSKPYQLVYSTERICAIKTKGSNLETVDDKSLPGDYFSRLLQLVTRLKFDYTCKNLQDVIYTKPAWGMDSLAQPVDLTKREAVTAKCLKVRRIKNNLVWLDSISYPFKVSTNEELIVQDSIYAVVVNINYEWYILSFSSDKQTMNKTIYI